MFALFIRAVTCWHRVAFADMQVNKAMKSKTGSFLADQRHYPPLEPKSPMRRQPLPEARSRRPTKDIDLAFRRILDVKDSHRVPGTTILSDVVSPIVITAPPFPIVWRSRRSYKCVTASTLADIDEPQRGRRHSDAALWGVIRRRNGGHFLRHAVAYEY